MPDNAIYYQAAYVVAAIVYVGYALLLVRRRARTRAALRAFGAGRGDGGA
jgi:hypothetical protein